MSLGLVLNNALSGLGINQQALTVLSQNIANANTQGYSRKIITQKSLTLDGNGAGVSIQDITRRVDEYLVKSIRLQSATVGRNGTFADYADRTQLMLGNPGSQNSYDSTINNFFAAVEGLAQTPESTTSRVNLLNSAKAMGVQAAQLAQGLQDLRYQTDQDIVTAVKAVNKDINDIRALNQAIIQDQSIGKSTAELQDHRDILVRDLAQYLDISTYSSSNGSVSIFTASGISLVDQTHYELSYQPVSSSSVFVGGGSVAPLLVNRIDGNGNRVGTPNVLATGGPAASVTTVLSSGKLKALLDLRDRQIPAMLQQFDLLTASFRDQVNRIHNAGSAFPGVNSLTGTHAVFGQDFSQWSGSARFAVLGADGKPIASPYLDEPAGMPALLMNLGSLNSGLGAGNPSVQGIIDEFNQYYGVPQNKAVVGNLNNIRLASLSTSLPGSPAQFSFDFNLENISANSAEFFVTGVQVLDDTNTDITSLTQNVPQVALAAANTYVTTGGSTSVTVNTVSAPTFETGDTIFLSTPPGVTIDGIPVGQLGGYVTVTGVSGNSFTFETTTPAAGGPGPFSVANQTATPPYSEAGAGQVVRTGSNGPITADLSLNSSSDYYTVVVNVGVKNANGTITTSQLTYQVNNNETNLLNDRYSVTAVTGGGTMVSPISSAVNKPIAQMMLVDANGVELPKLNGQYTNLQSGFLKIVANNSSHTIAIDSMDSNEGGRPNDDPPRAATNRGLSYFFELNNFFDTYTGPDGANLSSAANLTVQARLLADPNLISLGTLTRSPQSSNPAQATYTYERSLGDNSNILRLAAMGTQSFLFPAAGDMGSTTLSFSAYVAAIIGAASNNASSAKRDSQNADLLMSGYDDRSDSISGVNLDEELANIIIYQNAYAASAKVITVTSELYQTLIETF